MVAHKVFMVRPASFGYNPETAKNNVFQQDVRFDHRSLQARALEEFDDFVDVLRSADIEVEVLRDDLKEKRLDAIFPNNWFSTHSDQALITYPMYSPIRRKERNPVHIDYIFQKYKVTTHIAMEYYESEGMYLEGTGSMVIDHEYGVVYGCISPRTHPVPFHRFCKLMGYTPVLFHGMDEDGIPVYHTNVMMAVGPGFVVINASAIPPHEWPVLSYYFHQTDKEVIEITHRQMKKFAGNLVFIEDRNGQPCIVLSSAAEAVLNRDQKRALEKYGRLIFSNLSTIEKVGGGSARCMIAENYLIGR